MVSTFDVKVVSRPLSNAMMPSHACIAAIRDGSCQLTWTIPTPLRIESPRVILSVYVLSVCVVDGRRARVVMEVRVEVGVLGYNVIRVMNRKPGNAWR
jgi:hypothetical protein